jgi:hypothetical protein
VNTPENSVPYLQATPIKVAKSTLPNLPQLSTPTNGSASNPTTTGFTANWTAVSNAQSYDVKVYNSSAALVSITNASGQSANSVAISGLNASTYYTYTVTANGDNTNYINSSASSSSSNVILPLVTPTVGIVKLASTTGFTANWIAVANASSYDVMLYDGGSYVSTSNASGQATATMIVTTTLTAGHTYTYSVTAKGNGTSSDNSTESSAGLSFIPTASKTLSQYTASEVATLKTDLIAGTADIYELVSSGGAYQFTGTNATPITLTKSVTINGHYSLPIKPVLSISNSSTATNAAIFTTVTAGLTITLSNLNCNGVNANGSGIQNFLFYGPPTTSLNVQLVIRNCYIHDFLNILGAGCIRFDAFGSGLDMQNSIVNNCNGRVILFQTTDNTLTYGNLVLKNNTFSNITTTASGTNANANSFVFQRTATGVPAKLSGVNIDHCTFVNFNSVQIGTSAPQDILSLRGGSGTHSINNCIFDNIQYGTISYTATPTLSIDNNYLAGFGTPPSTTSTRAVSNTLAVVTPTYTNAGSLDFTLTNKSSLITADGYVAGNTFGASLSPLSPPTTLNDATPLVTSCTADWSSVSNATGYIVNVYTGVSTLVNSVRVATNSATVTGLTASTSYNYKVIAIGDATTY